MVKLNLGCSDDLKPGYVNVDRAGPADVIADLANPWPFEDSSADEIYAHDIFEHLNQIHAMNEAHRVLKPGGKLDLAVPGVTLSDGKINPGAFCDPTHISWWSLDTRYYFNIEWNNPQGERGRLGLAYGITALFRGAWRLVEYGSGAERRSKVVAMLEAAK